MDNGSSPVEQETSLESILEASLGLEGEVWGSSSSQIKIWNSSCSEYVDSTKVIYLSSSYVSEYR